MNAKRLSHADCAHPSTKVARAKCRRRLQKMASTIVAVASIVPAAPLMLMPAPIALSRTEYCTICAAEFETIAPESYDVDPICHRHTLEEATDVRVVTRENWREFKGQSVIVCASDADGAVDYDAQITGWSDKLIQFKSNGKTVRVPSERVVTVTTA